MNAFEKLAAALEPEPQPIPHIGIRPSGAAYWCYLPVSRWLEPRIERERLPYSVLGRPGWEYMLPRPPLLHVEFEIDVLAAEPLLPLDEVFVDVLFDRALLHRPVLVDGRRHAALRADRCKPLGTFDMPILQTGQPLIVHLHLVASSGMFFRDSQVEAPRWRIWEAGLA